MLGGQFLPVVMAGLHHALIPIHTTLIEQNGYTILLPVLAMAGAGQIGAVAIGASDLSLFPLLDGSHGKAVAAPGYVCGHRQRGRRAGRARPGVGP